MKIFTLIKNVIFSTILKISVHPRLRAKLLRLFGAKIGAGVRVHDCTFMNHELGFHNLTIEDGVYIGSDVLIDLAGPIYIGKNTTISARSILISHSDPGTSQGNYITKIYPASKIGISIKNDCWIGVSSIILEKSIIGEGCVLAAGCVVNGKTLESHSLYAGIPAKRKKTLTLHQSDNIK